MRRLIVCADGTWNKDEAKADGSGLTNVAYVKQHVRAADRKGTPQVVFYDPGVGNGGVLDRWFGGAFGSGISRNIRDDCYGFLVREFQPGDELFFFGFSRGAYTVRSLAGMVRKCGIIRRSPGKSTGDPLDRREREMIHAAYELYRVRGEEGHPARPKATSFREAHSHATKIKCLCVWDTVGSLGVPTSGPIGMISRQRHGFHDVQLSSHVLNGFHALAIDERRKPFAPALWEIPEDDAAVRAGEWRIEQQWFAGVHSNVGGGYPDRRLSHLALGWMIDRASECGLEFTDGFADEVRAGCNCDGVRYETLNGFYKVLGEHRRRIGEPRMDRKKRLLLTFEDVDSSVPQRCTLAEVHGVDRERGYRPANFLEYWSRNPHKWPELTPPRR